MRCGLLLRTATVVLSGLRELPYWSGYSKPRLLLHAVVTSKYFDLCIAGVIGVNVITMALEFYLMPAVCPSVSRCRSHANGVSPL